MSEEKLNLLRRRNTKQGQVWVVDLGKIIGSEQKGVRPCFILNKQKRRENTCIIIIASNTERFSTFEKSGYKFLLHQVRTIDTSRLIRNIERIPENEMNEVIDAFKKFIL